MITRGTGEILFSDALSFAPQERLAQRHLLGSYDFRELSVAGWTQHFLGVHESEHGRFAVEAVTDPARHIQTVFLSHEHAFHRERMPEDEERRAFHEGVLAADLAGQREFSWGEVFCRVHAVTSRDWIVVAYTLGPPVPFEVPEDVRHLFARADQPVAD